MIDLFKNMQGPKKLVFINTLIMLFVFIAHSATYYISRNANGAAIVAVMSATLIATVITISFAGTTTTATVGTFVAAFIGSIFFGALTIGALMAAKNVIAATNNAVITITDAVLYAVLVTGSVATATIFAAIIPATYVYKNNYKKILAVCISEIVLVFVVMFLSNSILYLSISATFACCLIASGLWEGSRRKIYAK